MEPDKLFRLGLAIPDYLMRLFFLDVAVAPTEIDRTHNSRCSLAGPPGSSGEPSAAAGRLTPLAAFKDNPDQPRPVQEQGFR